MTKVNIIIEKQVDTLCLQLWYAKKDPLAVMYNSPAKNVWSGILIVWKHEANPKGQHFSE